MALYPMKFVPRYVEKIWGGRKFEQILGKSLPAGHIGESWELYDFPPGVVDKSAGWISAQVANGPLAGKTLHDVVLSNREDLCGHVPLLNGGQFPILIKFLDAREDLSVQVHPNAAYCRAHPGSNLKTEAWYVMQHEEGSRILLGLNPGATWESLQKAIAEGTVESVIKSVKVKDGDCYFLPSGTIHALGEGILVAEVQTPSDTTFRVYDFKRIDPSTGKERSLHVQQAMETIDFSGKAQPVQPRSHSASVHTTVTSLCKCEFFTMEKVRFTAGVQEAVPQGEPTVWMMLEGEAQITVDGIAEPTTLKRGETVLLPAKMDKPMLKTTSDCIWIEVTLPARG